MNLGLVRLGGQIDTQEHIDDYVFNFSSKDPLAMELRGFAHLIDIFDNCDDLQEVRIFVNYHDDATLSVCLKLMHMFSHKIDKCYLLFESGFAMQYI